MKIPVIYEDEYLVVFDKPVGVVVNKSKSSGDFTLQSYLIEHYNAPFEELSSSLDRSEEDIEFDEFKLRSGIVHRLDKQTSGVIVVAKDEASFINLQKQFRDREVQKKYIALVLGKVLEQKIEIDAPIMRNPDYRYKMIMSPEGKDAFTSLENIGNFEISGLHFTMFNIFPRTGRTHQIRVHLVGIGHPVAGDDIYMTKKQYEQVFPLFNRLMLHANTLILNHPHTGDRLELVAPTPQEFNLH